MKNNCISREEIIEYIHNRLDQPNINKIKTHLNECEFCSDALDGYNQISDKEDIDTYLRSLDKKFYTKRKTQYYSLVASFVLVFTFYFILSDSTTYEKYYTPYKSDLKVYRNQNSKSDNITRSLIYYERKEYNKSKEILEKYILQNAMNDTALFYLGQIKLLQNQNPENEFRKVIDLDHSFVNDSHWYLALTYLKANNYRASKNHLTKILKESIYFDNAKSILKHLNEEK